MALFPFLFDKVQKISLEYFPILLTGGLMDFPSFGDASSYSQLATACASALTSSGGDVFNHCYSPLRPIGIILYYSIPLVVTRDPVNAAYVTLTFNLLLFIGAFLALREVYFFRTPCLDCERGESRLSFSVA